MEKEQILSTINEKLAAQGIKTEPFQRTFGDYVNENLPAEGTEPDDAYFDRHVRILKSISGQFNHEVAEQVEDFKKNYKPETTPPTNPPHQNPQPNKEVEELRQQIADFAKRLEERDSQQEQQQLMSQVKAEMKRQGADDDYVLRQTLRNVTLDPKKSVGELTKELLAKYDAEYSDCRGKGSAPRNGGGGGRKDEKPFRDFFEKKKANEGWGNPKK